MTAWDFPIIIVATVIVGVIVAALLIRMAGPKEKRPGFECRVCGGKQQGQGPQKWRYCPWCGAPRNARSLQDIPH